MEYVFVCFRENKNRYLFAFLKSLIDCGMFQHIYVNFLPVGHTHCDIDQLFSRIAVWLQGIFFVGLYALFQNVGKFTQGFLPAFVQQLIQHTL